MSALCDAPAKARRTLASDRVKSLSRIVCEEFGTDFLFYSGSTGELVGDQDPGRRDISALEETPAEIVAFAAEGRPQVSRMKISRYRLVLPIQAPDGPKLVAIGELPAISRSAQDFRLEQARLQKWLQSVQSRLSFTGWSMSLQRSDKPNHEQLRSLLEAFHELNELLGGLRIPGESSRYQNRILRRVATTLPVETLVWVPADQEETVVIERNHLLSKRECAELAKLLSKSPEWHSSGCMILNQVQSCPLGERFPKIINLIALAVGENNALGWLIAMNKCDVTAAAYRSLHLYGHLSRMPAPSPHPSCTERLEVAPFRRIDAALLMPFGSLLGLQSRSFRRQFQVQELFAGLLRSLTAAIDAKDSYTSGHSERVARVAVELGRELGLGELELGDIYLAGLLHDVGKIGIPDSILRKCGPLTLEEQEQTHQHVTIGYRILENFGAISHLLPFVLYHHEHYDGTGYPEGLEGEAIPRAARILAVADSFDAMNTARAYRPAMLHDHLEEILACGSNMQWDGEVINAFFRARERIYSIQECGVGQSVWHALHKVLPENGAQWAHPDR
jgi:HD-GYP domain-containing protein (c-di-GMP phosphodiesterase class II)